MLQVARLAPRLLGEAASLVADFLRSQIHPDGGFINRGGESDLYYTVFGLEGLAALQAASPFDSVHAYFRSFGSGESLDFIHLTCLARGWANLPGALREGAPHEAILARIEAFRSTDGGYSVQPGQKQGTLYACFLAFGAYQDLQTEMPDAHTLGRCILSLRARDEGYANQPDMPMGLTPSTAAAATLIRQLRLPSQPELADWLLGCIHEEGGFYATPLAPIPDLLSTATALHALAGMQTDLDPIRESCLDFIDTLWTNRGAFYGSWADDVPDCEYTYYGLLALGHLSL